MAPAAAAGWDPLVASALGEGGVDWNASMVWEAFLSAPPALGVAVAGGPQVRVGADAFAVAEASAVGALIELGAPGDPFPVDGQGPGFGRGWPSAVAGVPALGAEARCLCPPSAWDPAAGPPALAEGEVGFMAVAVGHDVLGVVRDSDQLSGAACIEDSVLDSGTVAPPCRGAWRAPAAAGAPGRCDPPASAATLRWSRRGRAVSPAPPQLPLARFRGVAP